jgi:hypothetical protein
MVVSFGKLPTGTWKYLEKMKLIHKAMILKS